MAKKRVKNKRKRITRAELLMSARKNQVLAQKIDYTSRLMSIDTSFLNGQSLLLVKDRIIKTMHDIKNEKSATKKADMYTYAIVFVQNIIKQVVK